ncbi:hypothetical protein Tco_0099500 [Tanacetum coccineum]
MKEAALKLQAEFDKEERLVREKAEKEQEANIALIETWDDIHAKIDVDHQLAVTLQAQEQEDLSIEEKNMEGYKLNDLKLKNFDSIQEMFDRAFKRVNTFEDFRTELVEGKEKRAGTELEQEITKKQKVEDDKETTELKQFSAYVRRIVADFSHALPNEYSPSLDNKKQESLVWFDFYKIPLYTSMTSRRLFKLLQSFRICLRYGCWFGGKLIQKLRQKGVYEESFSRHAAWIGREVNLVHAYYNGSCTSKDNEDPSWSTSFKTKRTQKTSSALEVLWKTLFLLYLYLIRTLLVPSCFVIFDL